MAFIIVTTDTNQIYLPWDVFITNSSESLPLQVNSKSSFTLRFAIWPFIGLISLIITVWILVYISTVLSRRHSAKNGHRKFASLYVSRGSAIAGGIFEYPTVPSPFDV
ncbi:unnamed protein product [Adineta steineri]|uniref:Uncharacterized protein n=1 Tax=Adineta steineri TaxID=433720 RepID=A0A815PH77_9BILA|nr:unnamed protein product [Adineta steineri]CAF1389745.1 unnamed protein product [Adineta steineri]CAF1414007.1 unnamed protein product [Adineta steineri]CAF1449152.1 unnamed protein product [Adineta steineri]CAF1629966.1 unnamed protein product [Adineta steineri]